jgi:hypothetical protein
MFSSINSLKLFLEESGFNKESSELSRLISVAKTLPPSARSIPRASLSYEDLIGDIDTGKLEEGYRDIIDSFKDGLSTEESALIQEYQSIITRIDSGEKEGFDFLYMLVDLKSDAEKLSKDFNLRGVGRNSSREDAIKAISSGDILSSNNDDGEVFEKIDNINFDEEAYNKDLDKLLESIGTTRNEVIEALKDFSIEKEAGAWDSVESGAKWVGDQVLSAGRASAGFAGKTLGRGLPVLGALITFPLFIKNLIEAVNNGIKIIYSLPLSKFGISKLDALSPSSVRSKILSAIDDNRKNPEALSEILDISNIIERFWLDFVFTVTNFIMLILDVIAVGLAFGIFAPGVGWAGALGGTAVQIGLTFGLVGAEFGIESLSKDYWNNIYQVARTTCLEEIREIEESNTKNAA